MESLYQDFLREKRYLENLSPKTLRYYQFVFNRWTDYAGALPDRQNLNEFVIRIQESGVSVFTANSYIRGMNAFLSWLHANEHIPEPLRIKKLKEGKRTLKVYTDKELKSILSFRPRTFADHRLYAMVCMAMDTGCRVDEMLSLKRGSIDFENLLVTVLGKGDKERVVPFSVECRKVLFKFVRSHGSDYVFPGNHGSKLDYKTSLDQLKRVYWKAVSWHKFRHTFATNYIREGGNVFFLQRILGHTDLQVTKIYVTAQAEDLKLAHRKTSLLGRLK